VRPGIPRLGEAVVAGAGVVNPGRPSPGVEVAAGAGVVNPGRPSPGVEVAAGAGDAKPGSSDEPPGSVELDAGVCGILIEALASGGGVAGWPPNAPATVCSNCGA
jgi:hypothetical protein